MKNKLFRRQFILSSNPLFQFNEWNNIILNSSTFLSVHPDLEITQSQCESLQVTLLGFVVNPFAPIQSNQEILDEIISKSKSFEDVLKNADSLGGRWIIIYQDLLTVKLFHDPCGQRQVYYYQSLDCILAGSDPAIINYFTKLQKDTSAHIQQYVNSPMFNKNENAWVGSNTIYLNVNHLMPNYYLNFKLSRAYRFWPNKPLEKFDLDKAVELAVEILRGSLHAVNFRYKLALAVTAGWDSRVLLAASKQIHSDIHYFVSVMGNEKKNFPDVLIPSRLFHQLGLPFNIQKCDIEIDPEFKDLLKKNVAMARVELPKATYIYKYHLDFKGMLNVNGNASEIAKTIIRPPFPIKVTGDSFAKLKYIGYGGITYVASQLQDWIDEVTELCALYNLNIFDMLYWEQRMGNWGAHYPAELDISMDQFSPFNNRLLLMILLSVDEKYRRYPNYTLYSKIIEKLWPEILSQPINVETLKAKFKHRLKHLMMTISGVYK